MRDALWFRSQQVEIVANGIPDPCPDFDEQVLLRRLRRLAARRALLSGQPVDGEARAEAEVFRIFYLAHCIRAKGVFDAVEGTLLAQARLAADNSPVRLHLTVAGAFLDPAEETELRALIAQSPAGGAAPIVEYAGFVSGEQKTGLLRGSDAFCFPTYYPAEGQPVNLIEAMACGLEIVTTRWRAIPEILPPDYPGFVPPRSPQAVADALIAAMTSDHAASLRGEFVMRFTEARYLQTLREVLGDLRPIAE
jgi:glycosyltransferase involved in cell wall biosynthesis